MPPPAQSHAFEPELLVMGRSYGWSDVIAPMLWLKHPRLSLLCESFWRHLHGFLVVVSTSVPSEGQDGGKGESIEPQQPNLYTVQWAISTSPAQTQAPTTVLYPTHALKTHHSHLKIHLSPVPFLLHPLSIIIHLRRAGTTTTGAPALGPGA